MTSGHHPTSRSPGDQAGHPDLESLADLDAGLVDPATTTRLTEHVRGCAVCSGTLRALAAIRSDLRSLPSPRLPDSVAARLDATLAGLRAEAGASAPPSGPGIASTSAGPPSSPVDAGTTGLGGSVDGSGPPPARGDVDDLAVARERRRERIRRTTTLAAASLVAVAALVGVGTAVLRQTQGHRVTESAAVPKDEGTRPSHASSKAGGVSGGPGGGAAPQAGPNDHAEASESPAPTYTRLTLVEAIPKIEQESTVARITAAGPTGPGGVMAQTARRASCSGTIPGASGQPIAVQHILFEGAPAYVFVYRDTAFGRRTFVVSADCGVDTSRTAAVFYSLSG